MEKTIRPLALDKMQAAILEAKLEYIPKGDGLRRIAPWGGSSVMRVHEAAVSAKPFAIRCSLNFALIESRSKHPPGSAGRYLLPGTQHGHLAAVMRVVQRHPDQGLVQVREKVLELIAIVPLARAVEVAVF